AMNGGGIFQQRVNGPRGHDVILTFPWMGDREYLIPERVMSRDPGRASHSATRQGETSAHVFNAAVAHAGALSVWQTLQAFGIFKTSLVAGVTKRNVWLRTFTSAIVCWILGMWQAIHSPPGLPAL